MKLDILQPREPDPAALAHSPIHADRSVPALVVKIGRYPWHHGGVGAIRSLGRLGIPVYAVTEDRWTPAATSSYLRGRFIWPTTGLEDPAQLVEGLLQMGRLIGRPSVLVPTDEEAAVLIAEYAGEFGDMFLLPRIEPSLPRRLASKRGLHDICLESGVATPEAVFPNNFEELEKFATDATFPVVVKNLEAFERRRAPVVSGTTRVDNPVELYALARTWGADFSVIIQDYVPREDAEDWIVHSYCDEFSSPLVQFTGVKVRSFPPHVGMTTCAYAVGNPALDEMTTRFIKSIGYRGVLDLDWRYDRRDGQYKLLDFNPRAGAQFRLFETEAGVDVVRALHLDLTGCEIPPSAQVDGRRFVLENLDIPARAAFRHSGYTAPSAPARASSTEFAWVAGDDIRPFFFMIVRMMPVAALRLWQSLQLHLRRTAQNWTGRRG